MPSSVHLLNQSPLVPGWNGDTWKAFVKFRSTREDLEMFVVDTDFGCGVVRRGSQSPLNLNLEKSLLYEAFEPNKKEWLNLISIEEFTSKVEV